MPSESFLKLNPGLGGLQPKELKSLGLPSLGRRQKRAGPGTQRMARSATPVLRILLLNFRTALLDGDNLRAGCKGMRDAIARSIGLDDNDSTIDWEYEQVRTRGKTGLLVRIEKI